MDYNSQNVGLVLRHEPDYSNDRDEHGTLVRNELPGNVVVGFDLGGAFVPLATYKKSTLDTMVETAQAQRAADEASQQQTQQPQSSDPSGQPGQQQQGGGDVPPQQ